MINEISHLKLGFASLATDSIPADNKQWLIQNLENEYLVFAKVEVDRDIRWTLTNSSIYLLKSNFLDYRAGEVFEAEIGKRLVFGKKVTAEKYLDYYKSLKAVCISQLPSYELHATLTFKDESDLKRYHLPEFIPEHLIEDGKYKVKIQLNSALTALYFITSNLCEKQIELVCHSNSESFPLPRQQPMLTQETLSLF